MYWSCHNLVNVLKHAAYSAGVGRRAKTADMSAGGVEVGGGSQSPVSGQKKCQPWRGKKNVEGPGLGLMVGRNN